MFTYSNLVYDATYTIYVKLEYTVEDNEVEYHYIDLIPVEFTYYGCPVLGDINGDGTINVLDIVQLANCVLGGYTPDGVSCDEIEYACAADMTGDGEYNVLDIVLLANCVLAQNCEG